MDKKIIIGILGGTILLTIAPLIFYLFKFGSLTFSADKSDWGTFGDYIGGTLNPLLTLINICVTVWIAVIVLIFIIAHNYIGGLL